MDSGLAIALQLCAVGVDLSRAPRAASPEDEMPPRSRGRGNAWYLMRNQRMLERE